MELEQFLVALLTTKGILIFAKKYNLEIIKVVSDDKDKAVNRSLHW